MRKDYRNYKEQDFLSDDRFLDWLRSKDASEQMFWEEWMLRNPDKKPVVENAVRAYELLLTFNKGEPSEADRQDVWAGIIPRIRPAQADKEGLPRSYPKTWLKYAAVLAVIACILSAGIWYRTAAKLQITSRAGTEEIYLPDGSLVALNSGSRLSYHRVFNSRKAREIWIEGKAFLDIVPRNLKPGQAIPFIVHLGALKIEVLGTSFNVMSNDSVSMVVLSEGKIQAFSAGRSIALAPGERLKVQGSQISKDSVNSDLYSAWRDGVFRFNNTSLDEIVILLTDYYQLEAILENPDALAGKVISGEVSAKDISSLFMAMEVIMEVEIRKEGKKVFIRNR